MKGTAEAVGQKASSAAAAVKDGLAEARQQLHGATESASDKARTWFDAVQVCMGMRSARQLLLLLLLACAGCRSSVQGCVGWFGFLHLCMCKGGMAVWTWQTAVLVICETAAPADTTCALFAAAH